MMPRRLVCLHGHFYQPPRENPWIEAIEVQDTADPFHDWNERVAAECYGPNGAARLKNAEDRIVGIANNYLALSFNFGPTLLAWLERHRPDAYARVLEADAVSLEQRGHGNAIAQGYSHAILPLCSPRDRLTQIRWGIRDFRRRFHRDPEGFWLPEAAADSDTLAALAGEGIQFTILSPYQARRVRTESGGWVDAGGGQVEGRRPYRVRAGSEEIAAFFYDGNLAQEIAFGSALSSADELIARIDSASAGVEPGGGVVLAAFDGETLGHHRKGGDEALAAAVRRLAARGDVELLNAAEALDRFPPVQEAEIVEPSSWSCAHGIERWRSDCGCTVGGQPGWRQDWRAPLREALDALRDRLHQIFEREAAPLLRDPWGARDRYVEVVLDRERQDTSDFLAREAGRTLSPEDSNRALRLLELERQSLLMYTSCGWFFADVSGIETVQVLKYAARSVQLADHVAGIDLEPALIEALARAPSNVPELRDARTVWERLVKPSVVSLEGVGAHLAISGAVRDAPREGRVFCYRYRISERREAQSGPAAMVLARVQIESELTRRQVDLASCVLHFGAADFRCGLVPWPGPEGWAALQAALLDRIDRRSLSELLREVDRAFPGRDYGLRDLFLDERRQVAEALLASTIRRYENHYVEIFEDNERLMEFLREIDSPVPGPLRVAADVALSRRLLHLTTEAAEGRLSLADAEAPLSATVEQARRLGAHLRLGPVRRRVEQILRMRVTALVDGRATPVRAEEMVEILALAKQLGLGFDLWEPQNRIWDWAGATRVGLDREAVAHLARALWFDEAALVERAGFAEPAAMG